MEEKKNEILNLTNELEAFIKTQDPKFLDKIEELKEIVEKLNNQQVQQKFNGLYSQVKTYEPAKGQNLDKILDIIENFKKSVEKNVELMEIYAENDRLDAEVKNNTPIDINNTINSFKNAIKNKDLEKITNCSMELRNYMLSLNDPSKVSSLNEVLGSILATINDSKKNIKDFTEEEIKNLLDKINELETMVLSKKSPEKASEKSPENLATIRKEMEDILGKSLYEGIENEYEHSISFQLDDYEVDKFQNLRKELKELLKDEKTNKERIDEIRVEMFIILNVNPYTYGKNKELIDALEEPNKSKFHQLKEKHEKLMENLNKKIKEDLKKGKNELSEEDKIRQRMAEILSKKNKKVEPFVGIEDTNIHDINWELDDNEKDEFLELKEKLDKIKGEKKQEPSKGETGLIPAPTPKPPMPTPTPTPKPPKKKRRLVKFAKKAKDFYKKHKKAILLVGGLVLFAVALHALLPSIMYFNSVLWNQAIVSGIAETAGLPVVLHDINTIIGAKIGATFTEATGIWTLANGSLLNAGAAQAGLLAALGKVALSAGSVGIGATLAVKNAYKLAKEKIQNRKNKKTHEKDPNKKSTFEGMKESFKKGFSKGKNKTKEDDKKGKEDSTLKPSEPNENKEFKRDDVSKRVVQAVNYFVEKGIISEEEKKELEKLPREEFVSKFKQIYNTRIEVKKDDASTKKEPININELKKGVPLSIYKYIDYCLETGIYTQEEVDKLQKLDEKSLKDIIYSDPRFIEFEKMRTATPEAEKSEGKSK